MANELNRDTYLSKNVGDFASEIIMDGRRYVKVDDLRYGTNPHAGFGLGFERLIMYLTGMSNIRDVLPFPRTTGSAEF